MNAARAVKLKSDRLKVLVPELVTGVRLQLMEASSAGYTRTDVMSTCSPRARQVGHTAVARHGRETQRLGFRLEKGKKSVSCTYQRPVHLRAAQPLGCSMPVIKSSSSSRVSCLSKCCFS